MPSITIPEKDEDTPYEREVQREVDGEPNRFADRRQRMGEAQIIDELTYISYATNRDLAPEVSVERWEKHVYQNARAMEVRYQAEKAPK